MATGLRGWLTRNLPDYEETEDDSDVRKYMQAWDKNQESLLEEIGLILRSELPPNVADQQANEIISAVRRSTSRALKSAMTTGIDELSRDHTPLLNTPETDIISRASGPMAIDDVD